MDSPFNAPRRQDMGWQGNKSRVQNQGPHRQGGMSKILKQKKTGKGRGGEKNGGGGDQHYQAKPQTYSSRKEKTRREYRSGCQFTIQSRKEGGGKQTHIGERKRSNPKILSRKIPETKETHGGNISLTISGGTNPARECGLAGAHRTKRIFGGERWGGSVGGGDPLLVDQLVNKQQEGGESHEKKKKESTGWGG